MKTIYKITSLILVYLCLLNVSTVNAQVCSTGSFQYPFGTLSPTSVAQFTSCNLPGDYALFNVTVGTTYTFSTCPSDGATCTYDSQLQLFNNTGLAFIMYSDDACGVQSRIVWTATFTGVARLTLHEFFCSGTGGSCTNIMYQGGGGYDPCTSITAANACGVSNTTVIASGNGLYAFAPYSPASKERIYTFTPVTTGNYTFTVSSNSFAYYTDFFYKPVSGGCNGSGWTFIQDVYNTGTSFGTAAMTAGTAYYIMLDEEFYTTGGTIVWTVNCVGGYDPCTSITAANACGINNTTVIASGTGLYAFAPYAPASKERIYTFTPVTTGNYTFTVSSNTFGYYTDFFYKPVSGGCNGTGWTFIQDVYNTGTSFGTAAMTAGTAYYIMLDEEFYTTGGTIVWTVNCVGGYDPCTSITASNACGVSNTTVIASGVGLYAFAPYAPASKERIYSYTAPTTGNYTITVTSNSYFYFTDFFYKAASGGCNGTGWTFIQDIYNTGTSFGSAAMTAGTTYYIMVDEEFYTSGGTVVWNLNCPPPPAADPCLTITNITACAVSQTATLTSAGAWNTAFCGWSVPGQEQVYSFTAATTGNYSIQVTSTTGNDYIDYAWKPAASGCSSGGWTCILDVVSPGTYGSLSWTAGTTYYILLDKENFVGATAPTTHTFNVTCPCTPPPNDDCSSAVPVTLTMGVPQTFTGNTECVTAGSDGAFNFIPTVWHAITLTGCATVTLNYCATSPAFGDVWLNLATSCPAFTFTATANSWSQSCPGGGLNYIVVFNNLPAGTYWIPVAGNEPGYITPGPYSLEVTAVACPPPPANDACTTAIPITCGSSVTGDNSAAADDVFPTCGSTFSGQYKGVWYSLTLPSSGTVTLSLCGGGPNWDSYLRLFSGTCSALNCVAFDDDGCGGVGLSTLTTAPIAAGTYYILVSSYSPAGFGAFTLTVNCALCGAPPAGGVASGPASGCTGSQVTLSVAGASSIQWQVSTTAASGPYTDIIGQNSATLNYIPASPGNYYFRVKASGAGCSDSFSNAVSVAVLASGGTLSTSVTPSSSACPGTTVNLTGNFTPMAASLTVTLDGNAYWMDEVSWNIINSSNVVIFSGGPYGYNQIITTTVTPSPSDFPVTFFIETQGNFNDNFPSYSIVCNSTSTLLLSGGMSGGQTFTSGPLNCAIGSGSFSSPSWTGPGGFTSASLIAPLSLTPTAGGVYTLTGTAPTGCQVSSSVTVTVLPQPLPDANSNAPVCEGTSLSLFGDNFAAGQSSGNSYSWTGPNGYSAGGQFPSLTATLLASGPYTVTVTNSFGCTLTASTLVTVNPNPVLAVNLAGTTPATCIGYTDGCIDVDASSGAAPYLYDYNGNSTIDGIYCGFGAGIYNVSVIDDNACVSDLNVTVIEDDQVDPQITCPPDVTAFNTPSLCSGVATWIGPVGTDNCAGATTLQTGGPASGSVFPVGITPITYTVTDLFNNTATCSYNVIIVDNQNPSITCPPDVIINADNGFCYASGVALGNPTTGDNCAVLGVANNGPAQYPVGATIVDWEVTDLSGNKAQCQQFVIVIDNQAPTIINVPNNITFTASPADCTPSISWTAPTANDNCSVASFTSNYSPGDDFAEGTTTVIYTAVDINGLSTTASFTVTILTQPLVVNLSSPVYQCGYNITCNGFNNGQAVSTVTGGCLPYTYLWSNGTLGANATSLTAGTYTLTVTDGNGHVTVQTKTLTQPPVLSTTLGPDQSFEFACSCANLIPATTGGSTCQPYTYAWSTGATSNNITVCPTQTATYTVTVTDINGCNTADVISIVKPALVGQLDRYVVLGTGTQNDQIGSNDYFYTGAVGHRLATGTISLNNNGTVNTWLAGNNVIIGNNSAVGTLYRNTASIGNNAVVGTTITPVTIPLTSKVPCFPTFSGGANVNVPGGSTVTISPGTYNNITTGNNSILKLNPGIYNVNSLSTGNGSSILPNGAATAKDLIMFIKTTMNTGNQNTINGNYYSQGVMNLGNGNNTSGVYRGAFFGKPVSTGNNLSFYLDSYCYSTLALCTVKMEGDETAADAGAGMFNLFPNPSTGQITIQYVGETGNEINVSVIDMLGQTLYERKVFEFTGELIQDIDLNNLNPGVYFIQLHNGDELINKQFVITR